ncbi:hypothetical protein [Bradyrhizobium sp. Tv2a-2]|uniref:hypothetical protein n=1 Tax=Bradyrhizobium sp. Tv2a-2 TaxID=113395 RepID=UPI00041E4F60|nr:hypothetical protein [Bradyrhizobium sp. Tv2a-2]
MNIVAFNTDERLARDASAEVAGELCLAKEAAIRWLDLIRCPSQREPRMAVKPAAAARTGLHQRFFITHGIRASERSRAEHSDVFEGAGHNRRRFVEDLTFAMLG